MRLGIFVGEIELSIDSGDVVRGEMSKSDKVWGLIAVIFFGAVAIAHIVKGVRYVVDDDYRNQRIASENAKMNKQIQKTVEKTTIRWNINGCNVPGVCDERGYRLDGDYSRMLHYEMSKDK
ncbi:hypothetical protein [Thalassospira sp. MCCC 1A03138]|uniref:hypothetical protein n=1 Tax=Thalassospira sp. MCCC 1A03138 TaxID=1470576 RepID=UPI000A1E8C12|nr:hypothetical protein [Thalassospira sp. MCCC 1A03138]OSQ32242.1 hypothetical protein TH468_00955 [Thalassospira sp. MCCC 1A03138]